MDSISIKLIQRKSLISQYDELYRAYLNEQDRNATEADKTKKTSEIGQKYLKLYNLTEDQKKLLEESLESQRQETKKARRAGWLYFGSGIAIGATVISVLTLIN